MNTIQRGIITLLKSAITGKCLTLPDGFSLEEADNLIRKQSLLPLAYQGACNCGIFPDSEIMKRYQVQYCQHMLVSEWQMRAVEQIYRAFDENGVDYLPVKGCIMKALYPDPALRIMGDADILIRIEQSDRIRAVMQKLQFQEKKGAPHEWNWQNARLHVELHKSLLPSKDKDLWRYFGTGWDRAQNNVGNRYELSVEDAYTYVFTHMTKHFRSKGIGARQIVDLYVYCMAYPNMDMAPVEQAMATLHLLEFHRNIRRLLLSWFEDVPSDEMTDYITDYIFDNGTWGSVENQMYADVLRRTKKSKVKNSKWKTFSNIVFPPPAILQAKYPVLENHPNLYPFYLVFRWGDVLINRPQNIHRRLGDVDRITDEKVSARQQSLKYMGLEFSHENADNE